MAYDPNRIDPARFKEAQQAYWNDPRVPKTDSRGRASDSITFTGPDGKEVTHTETFTPGNPFYVDSQGNERFNSLVARDNETFQPAGIYTPQKVAQQMGFGNFDYYQEGLQESQEQGTKLWQKTIKDIMKRVT